MPMPNLLKNMNGSLQPLVTGHVNNETNYKTENELKRPRVLPSIGTTYQRLKEFGAKFKCRSARAKHVLNSKSKTFVQLYTHILLHACIVYCIVC